MQINIFASIFQIDTVYVRLLHTLFASHVFQTQPPPEMPTGHRSQRLFRLFLGPMTHMENNFDMSFLCKLLEIPLEYMSSSTISLKKHFTHLTHIKGATFLKVVASCSWQSAARALHLEVTRWWFWRCQHLKKKTSKTSKIWKISVRHHLSFVSLWLFKGFATHVRFERWHGRYCQRCLCGQ